MLTQPLSLTGAQTSIQNGMVLADQSFKRFHPKIKEVASQAFAYGEYLSWARCAKFVPDPGDHLKNKGLCWIGDSCRLVKSGVEINTAIESILSAGVSTECKINGMMEAVQLALDVANTPFVNILAVKASRYEGHGLLTAAKVGAIFCSSLQAG